MNLEEKQKIALEEIVKSGIIEEFYLAGGTALLIRYNHRKSYDFDFFIERPEFDFVNLISNLTDLQILTLSKNTLIFLFKDVKFSLFCYNYPLIEELEYNKILNINIASDKDILCMKAVSIMQRGSKKDFFDLWFLMKINKIDLNMLIELCNKKYKDKFNEQILLKSLIFFEDAERERYKDIDKNWNEIKNFFVLMVKKKI